MKAFSVKVKRQVVDEKNLVKTISGKLCVKAEEPSDALFKAKEWLANNTEKGRDYDTLDCTASSIKEVISDDRIGKQTLNYECLVEFIPDKGKKGRRARIVVNSDTNAHASNKAEVYMGERNPVKVITCTESKFDDFIGFDVTDEQ